MFGTVTAAFSSHCTIGLLCLEEELVLNENPKTENQLNYEEEIKLIVA